jgi:phosphopantothenoylcysteine decarboxylase/phosphopantothenate--cysteine ligase
MVSIIITSGPTRQYLDPVRYLTNASSGRMGRALAVAAIEFGYRVTVITGPVSLNYPDNCQVVPVVTTQQMLAATQAAFETADGLIGAAAPCDYMPSFVSEQKINKTGDSLHLELLETPDIVATIGNNKKSHQWVVGFALETDDRRFRTIVKMQKKCCDLMVSNAPSAIDSEQNTIEIMDKTGQVIQTASGDKREVARSILQQIRQKLIEKNPYSAE